MSLTISLHRGVQQHPTRTFSVFAGRTMTYAQTAERVSRIAAGFKALGFDADDGVALWALISDFHPHTVLAVAWPTPSSCRPTPGGAWRRSQTPSLRPKSPRPSSTRPSPRWPLDCHNAFQGSDG